MFGFGSDLQRIITNLEVLLQFNIHPDLKLMFFDWAAYAENHEK